MWRVKSLDAILATAEKKSLQRSLGAFQLTMLGIGAIIGTGIFVLTAEAAPVARTVDTWSERLPSHAFHTRPPSSHAVAKAPGKRSLQPPPIWRTTGERR